MAQRIKGQEVRVIMVSPAGLETSLSDVQSFEVEPMMEVLSEGYLGETTERKDDIFKGCRGTMEINLEQTAYFEFIDGVVLRSQRRTPASARYNVMATMDFPNGTSVRVLMENIFFGAPPVTIGSREDYVTVSLEFECSEVKYLF